ncbi:hypothetical protein CMI47_05720 [Candidatus Pacearchaeota archaeon]|nr:hypothetical protein [Candidatus Pacearchaeota archaeon]
MDWYFDKKKLRQGGFLNMFDPRNFDKASPTAWIFFFAVIFIIIGLIIAALELLIIIGGLVIIFYVVVWIIWFRKALG